MQGKPIPVVPELFKQIMIVDSSIDSLKRQRVVSSDDLTRLRSLTERKRELRTAAEQALAWNNNKGKKE